MHTQMSSTYHFPQASTLVYMEQVALLQKPPKKVQIETVPTPCTIAGKCLHIKVCKQKQAVAEQQQLTGQAWGEAHLWRWRSYALRLGGALLAAAGHQDGGVDHICRCFPLRKVHVVGQRGLLHRRRVISTV